MRTTKLLKKRKLAVTLGSALALLSITQNTALAANVDAPVVFTGLILETCVVNVSTPGLLAVSSDATTLSSSEAGGISAIASVVTNSANSTIEVIEPSAFTLAPNGADDNTTFSTSYQLTGATSTAILNGTASTPLDTGATTMTIDAAATKSTGTYGAGSYTLTATVRCVVP